MVEKDNVWANTVNLVRKAKQNFGEKKNYWQERRLRDIPATILSK
jgi:hypothetical protein